MNDTAIIKLSDLARSLSLVERERERERSTHHHPRCDGWRGIINAAVIFISQHWTWPHTSQLATVAKSVHINYELAPHPPLASSTQEVYLRMEQR